MKKQMHKIQKSIWLLPKTWKVLRREARKRDKMVGTFIRDVLEEWSEANK